LLSLRDLILFFMGRLRQFRPSQKGLCLGAEIVFRTSKQSQ